ncbi:hypothetical protein EKG38_21220 [Shewanella canadensis]|uniref:Uncharacterized protein n=1 Tax=Shewanella canadensis TaxID=271096 RepID=A0A431WN53_9GAMM|nr:hypothetical protein [Shewanella canadensis]RTR37010.1 hypothetical protein EKG38_21220 [Shewanella canadensis]
MRIDKFWLQKDLLITFQPFSKEMTVRRQWIQRQEVEAFKANNNLAKVNIVALELNDMPPSLVASALDVEVVAHNHRSDIFQPGVLTEMDAFISARETLGVSFSYWGPVSAGADVGQ